MSTYFIASDAIDVVVAAFFASVILIYFGFHYTNTQTHVLYTILCYYIY